MNPITVYLEAVLGLNFAVNSLLLWLSGRSLGLPVRLGRTAGAGAVGAFYALGCLVWPSSALPTVTCKLAVGLAMLWLAYRPRTVSAGVKLAAVFGLSTAAFCGFTVAGLLASSSPTSGLGRLPGAVVLPAAGARFLLPGIALAVLAALIAGRSLRTAAVQRGQILAATVVVGGRQAEFAALVDTGNELVEPVSGRRVLVAEHTAVAGLIPPGLATVFQGEAGAGRAMEGGVPGAPEDWSTRLCFVPYRSLGAGRGRLLPGFRPDRVLVRRGAGPAGRLTADDLIIGVSPRPLAGHGRYQAILPAEYLPDRSGQDDCEERPAPPAGNRGRRCA